MIQTKGNKFNRFCLHMHIEKIILWLWTIAEINLQWGSYHELSDQHPCAKLGKEGESNFKTKDRLGDNEWCKPDDLWRAQSGHTVKRGPFFSFSPSHSTPLSI